MKLAAFRTWLAANYPANSAAMHFSQVKKAEDSYEDLDAIYDVNEIEKFATELNYYSQDAKSAIGQVTGYMGDLVEEESGASVRGVLVAPDSDKSCRSAVRAIPALKLVRYHFNFTFAEA